MANDMNVNDDMVMDLDLNQEPLEEPPTVTSFGNVSLSNELENARGRFEDRLRHLEAVTARSRQRQRWRQARNNPELSYMALVDAVDGGNQVNSDIGDDVRVEEIGGGERGRNSKRDISQLAKALEMDLDDKKKDDGRGGDGDDDSVGFFDCNICLEMARDPILTCCGHLFCWCCFYQLSYVDSNARECPVCKGEVTDSSITPIYGNGKNQPVLKLESGVKIPPRPRARRVESIRQQRVIRGISHIPVAEALRRIRIGIGSIGENPVFQGLNSVGTGSETNPSLVHNAEAGGSGGSGSRRLRSRQLSRVISESAASLSSISSALDNAERLVEDLETYINDRIIRRREAHSHILQSNQELDAFLGTSSETQPEPQNAEMNSSLPVSSSSQRSVATTVVHLDNVSDSTVEIDLTISQSHPPSSSRRGAALRPLSSEGGTSRELRRRRLSSSAQHPSMALNGFEDEDIIMHFNHPHSLSRVNIQEDERVEEVEEEDVDDDDYEEDEDDDEEGYKEEDEENEVEEENDEDEENEGDEDVNICSACEETLVGEGYSCTKPDCNFHLHELCFHLKNKIHHKSHLEHPLILLLFAPYSDENGKFTCNACFSGGTGFTYHCSFCQFDLHTQCVSLPETVKRDDHKHMLKLFHSCPVKDEDCIHSRVMFVTGMFRRTVGHTIVNHVIIARIWVVWIVK